MIPERDRHTMLAVPLCGPRVIHRLETIGVTRLADLRGRDPYDVRHEINIEAGRPIWHSPIAIIALQNLIDAASDEPDDHAPSQTSVAPHEQSNQA